MSGDISPKIRSSDVWKSLERTLAREGVEEFHVLDRRPHPILFFTVEGKEHEFRFPGTPSTRGAPKKQAGRLARRIQDARVTGLPCQLLDPRPSVAALTGDEDVMVMDIELRIVEGEARVIDTDIGERLGFARPDMIRQLIRRNLAEVEMHGRLSRSVTNPGSLGGRPSEAFFLNEGQALAVAVLSRAEKAAEVRCMLIKVFQAWRNGSLPAFGADMQEMLRRDDGILRMLAGKVTHLERVLEDMHSELVHVRGAPIAATFDLADTITAFDVIGMAGVKPGDRARGTANMVTSRLRDFCDGVGCFRTPEIYNHNRPWRFPRVKAQEWLRSPHNGGEQIRSQIARQRRKNLRPGQGAFALVGE